MARSYLIEPSGDLSGRAQHCALWLLPLFCLWLVAKQSHITPATPTPPHHHHLSELCSHSVFSRASNKANNPDVWLASLYCRHNDQEWRAFWLHTNWGGQNWADTQLCLLPYLMKCSNIKERQSLSGFFFFVRTEKHKVILHWSGIDKKNSM